MTSPPKRRLAWTLATWFGCGRIPAVPGTVGALAAIPLYGLALAVGHVAVVFTAIAVTAVGVWAASVVASELKDADPQIVVIDEVAGMLITMLPVPRPSLAALAIGFVLFRALDILKPGPVRTLERLPGGWGIMSDDVGAGAMAAAAMAALCALGLGS